ncbi:Tm-1-like ATP-binding domain-containing protein [Fredinandcohnia sp. QZ13]|uniref:Tm-1-like ATP-binding domain-containing protein n=1 Tax=Fredinandcohnia sp. QZ13 TaxID=3073144 RepID=UPI0028532A5F|nr:Tm-1-like ATP-binding domain-containing protein [Fredinandcohnia sp. QZ13]MDR4887890.1 Tm-1-like ATP-binding domain-containing protein [Fredinandcohnia sp. QZ13]
MGKTILLIGTLDTKGAEYAYVRDLISERGHEVILLNAGIVGEPTVTPTINAEEVAKAGGSSLVALREQGDRGFAMNIMSEGAANIAIQLCENNEIHGVMGMGGSGGTAVITHAMRALPVGFPKLVVSTVASGDVRPYVGDKDITMMNSVVDIAGLNRISRRILANAAGALCGMVEQTILEVKDKPLIATTMFGVTTPCVENVRNKLEDAGYEVLVFHATGNGGQSMEALIHDGFIEGVADISTTEWCDELVGGVMSAGRNRLEAAVQKKIPQVVSCGALDMVNFGAMETIPQKFADRTFYKHNANVTLMRTTPEECAELGQIIAEKLNQTTSPTSIFFPLKGVSAIDQKGQPFYLPEANAALFESIRTHLNKDVVDLIELDLHINDPQFAESMANYLLEKLKNK